MTMEIWLLVFVSLSTVVLIITFFILIFLYLTTNPYANIYRFESEKTFYDAKKKTNEEFPFGLTEKPNIDLSIIIPAYNEEKRLVTTLDEMIDYLQAKRQKHPKFSYEIIVVDDGSTDQTSDVARTYAMDKNLDSIRVLKLVKNRGKGGAVRLGMLSARGKFLIFADADGATKFSDIESLEKKMAKSIANNWNGSMAVICGSRAHLVENVTAKRNPIRNILMYGFHFAVWLLCVRGIKDTQCGFKLFSRQAARLLFMNLHVERWAFDVDILYLAKKLNIEVYEVPVNWHEVDGSKIVPVFSWLQMAKDLLLIRLRYSLGAWKIEPSHRLQ